MQKTPSMAEVKERTPLQATKATKINKDMGEAGILQRTVVPTGMMIIISEETEAREGAEEVVELTTMDTEEITMIEAPIKEIAAQILEKEVPIKEIEVLTLEEEVHIKEIEVETLEEVKIMMKIKETTTTDLETTVLIDLTMASLGHALLIDITLAIKSMRHPKPKQTMMWMRIRMTPPILILSNTSKIITGS